MVARQDFADGGALANALAGRIANDLKQGIESRGRASVAVSGGSTPKRFFSVLAADESVDWRKVTVTLVDERWVPSSSDRSNARLVADHLLQGPAAEAHFVPLYTGGDLPTLERVANTNVLQEDVPHPFDAVVLGMGNDGHTASFFPGGDALHQALTGSGPALAIEAPGAGEPRVTLTLPHLLRTRALYLHIEGPEKAETLARAGEDGPATDMPIRAVLRQTETPLHVFWCP